MKILLLLTSTLNLSFKVFGDSAQLVYGDKTLSTIEKTTSSSVDLEEKLFENLAIPGDVSDGNPQEAWKMRLF